MGIALTAALLFGVALYRGLTYMPDSDLTTLLIGTTVGFVLFLTDFELGGLLRNSRTTGERGNMI